MGKVAHILIWISFCFGVESIYTKTEQPTVALSSISTAHLSLQSNPPNQYQYNKESASVISYSNESRDRYGDDPDEMENQVDDSPMIQNNVNVKVDSDSWMLRRLAGYRQIDTLWLLIVILFILLITAGIISLVIIIIRTLSLGSDTRPSPIIVVPPPGENIRWTHEPLYEIPQNYRPSDSQNFTPNDLHATPPKP
jgi:hypothetical protein